MVLTPGAIKLLVGGAVIIVLAVGFRVWLSNRDARQDTDAALQQSTQTNAAASEIASGVETAIDDRGHVEQQVRSSRAHAQQAQEVLRRENETVRDWSDTRIPHELRDLDRAARLASKRYRDLQGGTETAPGSEGDRRERPIP